MGHLVGQVRACLCVCVCVCARRSDHLRRRRALSAQLHSVRRRAGSSVCERGFLVTRLRSTRVFSVLTVIANALLASKCDVQCEDKSQGLDCACGVSMSCVYAAVALPARLSLTKTLRRSLGVATLLRHSISVSCIHSLYITLNLCNCLYTSCTIATPILR